MEMEKDLRLYFELVERMVFMKEKLFALIALLALLGEILVLRFWK